MPTSFLHVRVAVVLAALWMLPFHSLAAAQSTATLYAVTATNRLVTVGAANPSVVVRNVPIGNLAVGESIVGIDVRPATRYLYGLGNTGQLWA